MQPKTHILFAKFYVFDVSKSFYRCTFSNKWEEYTRNRFWLFDVKTATKWQCRKNSLGVLSPAAGRSLSSRPDSDSHQIHRIFPLNVDGSNSWAMVEKTENPLEFIQWRQCLLYEFGKTLFRPNFRLFTELNYISLPLPTTGLSFSFSVVVFSFSDFNFVNDKSKCCQIVWARQFCPLIRIWTVTIPG